MKTIALDPIEFNYALFESDLNKWCKENGTDLKMLSINKFYRSKNYIAEQLRTRHLMPHTVFPLVEMMGEKAIKYQMPKEETKPKVQPQRTANPENGWRSEIYVDTELNFVAMKIYKGGTLVQSGKSHLRGSSDFDVIQGISYAAHTCYKLREQMELDLMIKRKEEAASIPAEEQKDEPKPEPVKEQPKPNTPPLYKDWLITKYVKENGELGRYARFVDSLYRTFPAEDEGRIRRFIQAQPNGQKHIHAFGVTWGVYCGFRSRFLLAEAARIRAGQEE